MPQDLQGTWQLRSWYNQTEDGKRVFPLGPNATGYLSYSADDHVFVHLAAADRAAFASNDLLGGSDAENAAAMRSHVTYAGRYARDGDDVLHHVTQASIPNWVGTTQRRRVDIRPDGTLALSASGAMVQGQTISAFLEWPRADAGSAA